MCHAVHRRGFLTGLAALFPASQLRPQSIIANRELPRSIADAANALMAVLRPELRSQLEFPFGIETVNMIRKGQVRWLEKGNIIGQIAFMAGLFGLTAVV